MHLPEFIRAPAPARARKSDMLKKFGQGHGQGHEKKKDSITQNIIKKIT
jgi:hypothetical protein